MKKYAKNVHQELVPDPFLKKIRYFERGLSWSLKEVNFVFSFRPNPFWWTKYQKQKWPETSGQSVFKLQSKLGKFRY